MDSESQQSCDVQINYMYNITDKEVEAQSAMIPYSFGMGKKVQQKLVQCYLPKLT